MEKIPCKVKLLSDMPCIGTKAVQIHTCSPRIMSHETLKWKSIHCPLQQPFLLPSCQELLSASSVRGTKHLTSWSKGLCLINTISLICDRGRLNRHPAFIQGLSTRLHEIDSPWIVQWLLNGPCMLWDATFYFWVIVFKHIFQKHMQVVNSLVHIAWCFFWHKYFPQRKISPISSQDNPLYLSEV